METIGFIGLGHMGHFMARNLLKNKFKVIVYDVQQQAMDNMREFGAECATSLKELAEQSDYIFTMVQTSQQVHDLCLCQDGIFDSAKENLIYIDCSSIDVAMTHTLHQEAAKNNIRMLDAPVSGGVVGAELASLTFMVGGVEPIFNLVKPILDTMGKNVIYAGAPGSGQAAKICNNMLLGISMIGVCEAFSLAEKLGLDPNKFFEISSKSSGQCWSMTSYCPVPGILGNVPSDNHYQPGFMAKMMLKDLRLAHHAAENVNALIPLGALTTELYELFINQGNGDMDFSGIIKYFKASSNK